MIIDPYEIYLADRMMESLIEAKPKLERSHGVLISGPALRLAAELTAHHLSRNRTDCELREKVFEIVDEACLLLRHTILNGDERNLDEQEYILCRSLIEYNELVKLKHPYRREWLLRVEEEVKSSSKKLGSFIRKWKPVLMSSQTSHNLMLEYFDELMTTSHSLISSSYDALIEGDFADVSWIAQQFGLILDQLLEQVQEKFKDAMTVGCDQVAEVVSRLTGIPLLWLEIPGRSKLRTKALLRLRGRVVDQPHVIDTVFQTLFCSTLERERSLLPMASFLFLGLPGVGKKEIAKCIAEHIFGSVDRLIRIDMSDYAEPQLIPSLSVSSERLNNEWQESILGRLAEAVRDNPYSVVLFDNIEKAHSSALEILHKIVKKGLLTDGEGNRVVFYKTIVIFTSSVGADQLRLACTCFNRSEKLMKEFKSNMWKFYKTHDCTLKGSGSERVHGEARRFFSPDFLNSLDHVLVLNSLKQMEAVTRLLLREHAITISKNRSISERPVIVYPSDAALFALMFIFAKAPIENGNAVKRKLNEYVVPMLYNCIEDVKYPTIYIDTLVGTRELSFRLETSECVVEDYLFKLWKVSFRRLRDMYQKEKQLIGRIFALRRDHSILMDEFGKCSMQVDTQVLYAAVQSMLFCLCQLGLGLPSTGYGLNEVASSSIVNNWHMEKAKTGVQNLRLKLQDKARGLHPAIDVIDDAVLRSIGAPQNMPGRPAACYLFVGLNIVGKRQLIKDLANHLRSDDGKTLLIHIQLSRNFTADICGVWLLELVKRRPNCVIFFDLIELADASVYSTLLKILDNGMIAGRDGSMVDFRNTTIILTSNVGNKSVIAKIFCHYDPDGVQVQGIQEEAGRFRSELLYRMDEIMIFNPLTHDQRGIARLSMKEGPHLEEAGVRKLNLFLYHLFLKSYDGISDEVIWVVSYISKALKWNGPRSENLACSIMEVVEGQRGGVLGS